MQLNTLTRSVRVAVAMGMLLALVLLTACAAPTSSTTVTGSESEAEVSSGTPPTLRLTTPAADAVVPAGTVAVAVETTGHKFVMASNTNVPGEGHVHFTLDDRPFIMSITPEAELEDVEPGPHTLIAELVQNNTQPFDPPIKETIEFVAE